MAETADRELIAQQFLAKIGELDKLRDDFKAADARVDDTKRVRDERLEAYVAALGEIKKAGWGATAAGLANLGHVMPSNLKRNRRNASGESDENNASANGESSNDDVEGSDESWDQR